MAEWIPFYLRRAPTKAGTRSPLCSRRMGFPAFSPSDVYKRQGLGGGFAGYGIYPQYKEYYAFHIFYEDLSAKKECESFLERHFDIINLSKIPVRRTKKITGEPLIWRYFVMPLPTRLKDSHLDEKEFVARSVININSNIQGAYVFSSGKNMGVFKAVGFPEDVGDFYRLEEYDGYCWTCLLYTSRCV